MRNVRQRSRHSRINEKCTATQQTFKKIIENWKATQQTVKNYWKMYGNTTDSQELLENVRQHNKQSRINEKCTATQQTFKKIIENWKAPQQTVKNYWKMYSNTTDNFKN